jgi:hypothetical protein
VQQAAHALAFFLPGIAVGLCKVLLQATSGVGSKAGSAAVGPSTSSAAAITALQALTVLLVACLGNAAVEAVLQGGSLGMGAERGSDDAAELMDASSSADALQTALRHLQMLAKQAKGGSAPSSQAPGSTPAPDVPACQPAQQGRMRVSRDAAWVADTAHKLHELLCTVLLRLATHSRPAVREAVVLGELAAHHRISTSAHCLARCIPLLVQWTAYRWPLPSTSGSMQRAVGCWRVAVWLWSQQPSKSCCKCCWLLRKTIGPAWLGQRRHG